MNSKRFGAGWRPLAVLLEPEGCWYCWKVIWRWAGGWPDDEGWRDSSPTTISPRSMLGGCLGRGGEPGSDKGPEGGDESSPADDSYRDVSPAAAMFGRLALYEPLSLRPRSGDEDDEGLRYGVSTSWWMLVVVLRPGSRAACGVQCGAVRCGA